MIIGAYYLTETSTSAPGEGRAFSSLDEAVLAYDERLAPSTPTDDRLSLHAHDQGAHARRRGSPRTTTPSVTTSTPTRSCCAQRQQRRRVGARGDHARAAPLQRGVPARLPVPRRAGQEARPHRARRACWSSATRSAVVAESLDKLKDLGFEFATRSGLTISIADVQDARRARPRSSSSFEDEAEKVESQFERGIITDDERRQKEIEIWTEATARGP